MEIGQQLKKIKHAGGEMDGQTNKYITGKPFSWTAHEKCLTSSGSWRDSKRLAKDFAPSPEAPLLDCWKTNAYLDVKKNVEQRVSRKKANVLKES